MVKRTDCTLCSKGTAFLQDDKENNLYYYKCDECGAEFATSEVILANMRRFKGELAER